MLRYTLLAIVPLVCSSYHFAPVLRGTSPRAVPSVSSAPAAVAVMRKNPMPVFMTEDAADPAECQVEKVDEDGCTETKTGLDKFRAFSTVFCNLFPVWIVITAATGLLHPPAFAGVSTKYFTALIGALMLCMGITLKPSDFARVLTRPGAVMLAFAGCYGLMPALAIGLSKLFGLSKSLTAGMILLSAINGAQASNLCTYIGKGDVALSVLMTTMTTVGAIVMTPLVAKILLGTVVPVNAAAVALSTMQVVLIPIGGGMLVNANFPETVQKVLPFSPIVGVLSTCALVGAAVAGTAGPIMSAGAPLQAACALMHLLGGAIAYFGVKSFYSEKVSRTFGIEIAMKSSAFGYLLASLHFAADPLVRVPSAVSIVWMTLVGSSLAVASRFLPPKDEDEAIAA